MIDATLRAHPQGRRQVPGRGLVADLLEGLAGAAPGSLDRPTAKGLQAALNRLAVEPGLAARAEAAMLGDTGIDGFDHWAQELVDDRLSAQPRPDVVRLDLDLHPAPAVGTGGRFLPAPPDRRRSGLEHAVAGAGSAGCTRRARPIWRLPTNIAKNTGGRFHPEGLAPEAPPLPMSPPARPAPRPGGRRPGPDRSQACFWSPKRTSAPSSCWIRACSPQAIAVLTDVAGRSPLAVADPVHRFTAGAIADTLARLDAPDAPRL